MSESPQAAEAAKPDAAETESPFKPEIVFEDFARVDLRVAKILEAVDHPKADRLLKLTLDDGSGTPRQICAGIKGHYDPADLVGKSIVVVANLAPRQLRGEESRGMLLAGSDAAKGQEERTVVLLSPMADLPPGSIVS
ncbi:MAG: methionine--tRNA ligase subunit beta [Phycisphaerales bacterium]|jgi:methionine--tRNA ligase beta chain